MEIQCSIVKILLHATQGEILNFVPFLKGKGVLLLQFGKDTYPLWDKYTFIKRSCMDYRPGAFAKSVLSAAKSK